MVSGGFKKVLCGVLLWTAISFSAVLVEALDREVWRAKAGEIVMAEDKDHIYI